MKEDAEENVLQVWEFYFRLSQWNAQDTNEKITKKSNRRFCYRGPLEIVNDPWAEMKSRKRSIRRKQCFLSLKCWRKSSELRNDSVIISKCRIENCINYISNISSSFSKGILAIYSFYWYMLYFNTHFAHSYLFIFVLL